LSFAEIRIRNLSRMVMFGLTGLVFVEVVALGGLEILLMYMDEKTAL